MRGLSEKKFRTKQNNWKWCFKSYRKVKKWVLYLQGINFQVSKFFVGRRSVKHKYLSREKYTITREFITFRDTHSGNNSQKLIWKWSNRYLQNSSPYKAFKVWNLISDCIKQPQTLGLFKVKIKTWVCLDCPSSFCKTFAFCQIYYVLSDCILRFVWR